MARDDAEGPVGPYPVGPPASNLSRVEWQELQQRHRETVDAMLADHVRRARAGLPHPVEDFLFHYYSIRPGHLRRWHPGLGVIVEDSPEFATRRGYRSAVGPDRRDHWADPAAFISGDFAGRYTHLSSVRERLRAIDSRAPAMNCFGLHEWAMVYGLEQSEVRHSRQPLRVGTETIRQTVDDVGLRCSHFDAYRFFAASAAELNPVTLTSGNRNAYEQPGCLHNTMDLYRWAAELQPLSGSNLVLRCFQLARDARTLDMRASPYDLTDLGYQPIAVETAAGRRTYVAEQRSLADRGAMLRAEISDVLDRALTPGSDHFPHN